jgi:endonuclease YncB( thermonuclease family)
MSKPFQRNLVLLAALLAIGISAGANVLTIKKVLGADVVQIGDTFVARLTGIKAPERDEPLGPEVYEFTKSQIEGKTVKVFTWTTDNTAAGIVYDDKGRAFVQIYYGKDLAVSFNETLLKKGYARVDPKALPDDLRHYLDLEKEAREKGLGIWGYLQASAVAQRRAKWILR